MFEELLSEELLSEEERTSAELELIYAAGGSCCAPAVLSSGIAARDSVPGFALGAHVPGPGKRGDWLVLVALAGLAGLAAAAFATFRGPGGTSCYSAGNRFVRFFPHRHQAVLAWKAWRTPGNGAQGVCPQGFAEEPGDY